MASFRRLFLALFVTLAFCQVTSAGKTKPSFDVTGRTNKKQASTVSDIHPALVADVYSIHEDVTKCFNVLINDYDAGARSGFQLDSSTLAIYKQPINGMAWINHTVACYKPDDGFSGEDIFAYTVCDTNDRCEWEEVKVYVKVVADAPYCVDDDAVVSTDVDFVVIDVLKNDQDSNGAYVDYSTLRIVVQPCDGTAVVTPDNKIIYIPSSRNFYGTDQFTYEVCDNMDLSLCGHADVYIQVDEKCETCENCQDLLPTFNFHREWINSYYHSDVLKK